MQSLEVSGAVRSIYGSLGVKRLKEGYVSSKCSGKYWETFYSISGNKKDNSSMGTCVLNHNTLPISIQ